MKLRYCLSLLSSVLALGTCILPRIAECAPGDLYVAETTAGGHIYRFTSGGTKSTFASGLNSPTGLAFDRQGNLFVVENESGSILEFAPNASSSIFASGLSAPTGLAFDGMGNLFVTESFGDVGPISKFTPAGMKTTFASGQNLRQLVFDFLGNLFASSIGATDLGGSIEKIAPDGNGDIFALGAGPGMAVSHSGHLFATDRSKASGGIAEFDSEGGRTIFTTAVQDPAGMAFDYAGNLFVTDAASGKIFKLTASGEKSTFASGLDHPTFLAFEPFVQKLRNISARGLVGTGDETLIGGFIVGGSALANNAVVIRALGPSLSVSGVPNALQDPVLELHDASGATVATNDDWQDTQRDLIEASGLAPRNAHESAIFATLPAGAYTAVVRGAGNTSGVALAEIYGVDQ